MPITIDNLPPISTIDPPDLLVVHNVATDRTKGISYQNLLNELITDINAVTQGQLNTAIANVTAAYQAADTVVLQAVFHVGCKISVTSGPFVSNYPGSILGFGTWVQELGNYYRAGSAAGDTYGTTFHNHTGTTADTILNGSQIPEHSHTYKDTYHTEHSTLASTTPAFNEYYEYRGHSGVGTYWSDYDNDYFMYKVRNTEPFGGSLGHNHVISDANHLPPTMVEIVWRRIS